MVPVRRGPIRPGVQKQSNQGHRWIVGLPGTLSRKEERALRDRSSAKLFSIDVKRLEVEHVACINECEGSQQMRAMRVPACAGVEACLVVAVGVYKPASPLSAPQFAG